MSTARSKKFVRSIEAHEIPAPGVDQQRHDPLVGSTEATLERKEANGREVRVTYRARLVSAVDPGDDLRHVERIASFVRAAVQLAEHATPVPAGELALHRVLVEPR